MLASVSIILTPWISGFAIPSFVPVLWFQFWEIPVFVALFLIGLKSAVMISFIDAVFLLSFYPGAGFNDPVANLGALLSTLVGVYLIYRSLQKNKIKGKQITEKRVIVETTAVGIIFRVGVMVPLLYVSLTVTQLIPAALIPLALIKGAAYDAIYVLYTVPIGYLIGTVTKKSIRNF